MKPYVSFFKFLPLLYFWLLHNRRILSLVIQWFSNVPKLRVFFVLLPRCFHSPLLAFPWSTFLPYLALFFYFSFYIPLKVYKTREAKEGRALGRRREVAQDERGKVKRRYFGKVLKFRYIACFSSSLSLSFFFHLLSLPLLRACSCLFTYVNYRLENCILDLQNIM